MRLYLWRELVISGGGYEWKDSGDFGGGGVEVFVGKVGFACGFL